MRVHLIAVISLLLLTACGQKGPLYLPQDQSLDNNLDKPASRQDNTPDDSQSEH